MFLDLVKASKSSKRRGDDDEVSPERIRELMDDLFSKGDDDDFDDEDMDKGYGYGYSSRDKLRKEADLDDDLDDEDMDKGHGYGYSSRDKLRKEADLDDNFDDDEDMSKNRDNRRALMDQVYSMVDDLNDEELKSIIETRMMRKALAMSIIDQMPTSELSELVDQLTANGGQGMSPLDGEMDKGAMMEMEMDKGAMMEMEMDKGEGEDDLDDEDME